MKLSRIFNKPIFVSFWRVNSDDDTFPAVFEVCKQVVDIKAQQKVNRHHDHCTLFSRGHRATCESRTQQPTKRLGRRRSQSNSPRHQTRNRSSESRSHLPHTSYASTQLTSLRASTLTPTARDHSARDHTARHSHATTLHHSHALSRRIARRPLSLTPDHISMSARTSTDLARETKVSVKHAKRKSHSKLARRRLRALSLLSDTSYSLVRWRFRYRRPCCKTTLCTLIEVSSSPGRCRVLLGGRACSQSRRVISQNRCVS